MDLKNLPRPKSFTLQWHITERCNLRCTHCYQDDSYLKNEMNTKELYKVLDQYVEILRVWGIKKGHISVTGGEPFIRKDLFNLLERFYRFRNLFSFSILTNGMFITRDIAKRLKKFNVQCVQISIEGMKKNNDEIRGRGTFKKIVRAAEILVRESVHTSFSFTSSKMNYQDFPRVVELGKKIGVNLVWTDRLVPCGRGSEMRKLMLEPLELKEYYQSICHISKILKKEGDKTRVPTRRALYSLVDCGDGGRQPHICPAGRSITVIMPNGDVFPCRRMPIKVGNVTKRRLLEIWYTSPLLKKLRSGRTNEICARCSYFERCRGGARCISYAYFKDPFAPDPQCWIAFKKIPPARKNFSVTRK